MYLIFFTLVNDMINSETFISKIILIPTSFQMRKCIQIIFLRYFRLISRSLKFGDGFVKN